jgi:hypothetical protein
MRIRRPALALLLPCVLSAAVLAGPASAATEVPLYVRASSGRMPLTAVSRSATCPGGYQLVGGGYCTNRGEAGAPLVLVNYPSADGTSWNVGGVPVRGSGGGPGGRPDRSDLGVGVTCLKLPGGLHTEVVASATVSAVPAPQTATVSCPAGSVITSGGWKPDVINAQQKQLNVASAVPNAANTTWSVTTGASQYPNGPDYKGSFTAYAICAPASVLDITQIAGTQHTSCGDGRKPTGGGFKASGQTTTPGFAYVASDNRWKVLFHPGVALRRRHQLRSVDLAN